MAANVTTSSSADELFVLVIKNIKIHAPPEQPFGLKKWRNRQLYISASIEGISQPKKTKPLSAKGPHARWEETISFNLTQSSTTIVFSMMSKHLMRHDKSIGAFRESIQVMLDSGPHVIRDLAGKHKYQIEFDVAKQMLLDFTGAIVVGATDAVNNMDTVQPMADPPAVAEAAPTFLSSIPSDVKSSLESLLSKLDILCQVGGVLAEIHPWAKMAFNLFSTVYKVIKKAADCDQKIQDLVSTINEVFTFAQEAQALPDKYKQQKKTITVMLQQAVECGYFIEGYVGTGNFWLRAWRQAGIDTDKPIGDFKAKFESLKEDFKLNSILQTQLLCILTKEDLEATREIVTKIELKDIPYAYGAAFQPSKACLPGTREALLDEICQWINSNTEAQVLLLTGLAGTGKSTVAHTIAKLFNDTNRLGSSFFFSKSKENYRDMLFGTIARDLADQIPEVRDKLAKVVTASRGTLDFEAQFTNFLENPTEGLVASGPIVIVLDALDEIGDIYARGPILETLANRLSCLPSNFRILLTSRAEHDIMEKFKSPRLVQHMRMEQASHTHEDISHYIYSQLAPEGFPLEGLQPTDCQELVEHAGGLFQWAFVACDFIMAPAYPGVTRQEKFTQIVSQASSKSDEALNSLYRTVLTGLFVTNNPDQNAVMEKFRNAVGPVLASSQPLSMESLHALLSRPGTQEGITMDSLQCILTYMGSVLDGVTNTHEPIQPLHKSFYDFLTKCSPDDIFFIDLPHHHWRLCQGSLRIINTHLNFNHCNLKTSYKPNIAQQYNTPSPEVSYACQSLGHHLEHFQSSEGMKTSTKPSKLIKMVEDFLKKKLLCWLEILSILGKVYVARPTLLEVAKWVQVYNAGLQHFAEDAAQFALYFGIPIAISAPHIYLSAMAFAPAASLVALNYQTSVVNMLQVTQGRLKKWPAQQLVLHGHKYWAKSVAFSPYGKLIVSGSDNKTIRLWNAQTGEAVGQPLRGHHQVVNSVAFSPDGKLIVSGSDDMTIRLWNAQTGEAVHEPLRGHHQSVSSVAFCPNGKLIVSGSDDMTIRLWNAQTGEAVHEPLRGHHQSVSSVAFCPNGKLIVSGSCDKTIRLWNAQTGEAVGQPLRGHGDWVNSVAFSPDGKLIVSESCDNTIRLWNAQTREAVGEPSRGHKSLVQFRRAYLTDGWFRTPQGDLLFWVPPIHRRGLLVLGMGAIIPSYLTRVILDKFVHGDGWEQCFQQ
ncbi:hypothetical protein GLOTRDRAFT_128279 [Gloeophyllum trabeum ATCC 11539]|uniref:NACHT domain-containing protein n=1 Tax=Gloeophyllum trabeum (strain ATCC 11539 / FP-39264 / Madison 617) TaxID=670483 RepID=S7QAC9_GLOTA|nr:uncharacterized protein GLOTRDRAFT_128279 [Gloeophyllum trabeum ATCC 11539]EPQ56333.1 hypothetical protein GLOTRDRAFT_128279 [Gloeophyllum trabeum ATCC 11539]